VILSDRFGCHQQMQMCIKIANGIYEYNFDSASKRICLHLFVSTAAKGFGFGLAYVFGDLPKEKPKQHPPDQRLPLNDCITSMQEWI
jgi:hypothetical protein